jgi:hypothetical protein
LSCKGSKALDFIANPMLFSYNKRVMVFINSQEDCYGYSL